MLIAIFRSRDASTPAAARSQADGVDSSSETVAPASPATGAAVGVTTSSGAAVSWVAGRFFIHGRGEVTVAELMTLDAGGDLEWVDARACAWLRSQASGQEPTLDRAFPAPPSVTAHEPDSDIWGKDKPALWERFGPEHYRIATYAVLGVIVVLLIVLVAQGGPCQS